MRREYGSVKGERLLLETSHNIIVSCPHFFVSTYPEGPYPVGPSASSSDFTPPTEGEQGGREGRCIAPARRRLVVRGTGGISTAALPRVDACPPLAEQG